MKIRWVPDDSVNYLVERRCVRSIAGIVASTVLVYPVVVKGKLVNRPSDPTGERPVSDAMLILPRRLQQKHQLN